MRLGTTNTTTLALGLALGLGLAAGCSDNGNGGARDGGPDAAAASVITIGVTEQLTSLDPAEAYQTGAFELLLNINQTLYVYDPERLDYVPLLAAAEPEVATQPTPETDDGAATEQTWTVRLREGLVFADGTALNADAVKYSIDRARAYGGKPVGLVAGVKRVDKVDDLTVRFALTAPTGFFKALMATPTFSPVNRASYPEGKALSSPFSEEAQQAAWGEKFINQNTLDPTKLLGAGAYTIESISTDDTTDPANGNFGRYTQIVLRANPSYSGGPNGTPPRTARIIVKFYADSAALQQALQRGDVQVAWNTLESAALTALAADQANYTAFESAGLVTEFLCFNMRLPPFGTAAGATAEQKERARKLRRAIALAVDRDAIVRDIWQLTGRPLYSMIPQGLWSYSESFKSEFNPQPPNLAETARLLREAGYSETNKLSFGTWYTGDFPENVPMAAKVKADLESTGLVETSTTNIPGFNTYAGTLTRKDAQQKSDHTYPMFWLGWAADFGDPDNFVYTFAHSSEDLVGISLNSPAMDTLLDEARTSLVFETRRAKYQQAQALWANEVPTIPVVQRIKQAVARKGYTLTPPGPNTLLNYATVAATAR